MSQKRETRKPAKTPLIPDARIIILNLTFLSLSILSLSILMIPICNASAQDDEAMKYFQNAEKEFFSDNFEAALSGYEQVLQQYPNFNETDKVLFKKAMTQMRLGMNEEAKATFDQIINKYPESKLAESAKTNKQLMQATTDAGGALENQLRAAGAPAEAITLYKNALNGLSKGMIEGIYPEKTNETKTQKSEWTEEKSQKIIIIAVILITLLASIIIYLLIRHKRKNQNLHQRKHH
jgi:tetratricopeptide (TPR) repeat protein